jgi:flavorubredoxin
MKSPLRILIGLTLTGSAILLYATIWDMTGPMARNIENAAEAGIDDTVSQASWQNLVLRVVALVFCLVGLWLTIPTKYKKTFSAPEALLVFVIPLSTTSVTPLIGAFAEIFAFWIFVGGLAIKVLLINKHKVRT